MADNSEKTTTTNGIGGNEPAVTIHKDGSVRESKYKLWTAIITLLSVAVGFAFTTIQLVRQSNDLRRIEQNFQSMNQLKKALMMPLEGLWDYKVKYKIYLGEKDGKRY